MSNLIKQQNNSSLTSFRVAHYFSDLYRYLPQRYILITDNKVASLWLKEFINAPTPPLHCFIIQQGETEKSIKNWQSLVNRALSLHLTQDTAVIALGGGVVTDFAGFFAATYLRGLPLILCPTTLLAQVDAACGGKNALNLAGVKNVVGQIYHPLQTLVATESLKTLPRTILQDGLVESFKVALISGKAEFDNFKNLPCDLKNINWQDLITKAIEQKMSVVNDSKSDPKARWHLNLGHTLGHAIEAASDFSYRHGEAVAIGLSFVFYFSLIKQQITQDYFNEVMNCLKKWNLLPRLPKKSGFSVWWPYIKQDKKSQQGDVYWVCPKGPGVAVLQSIDASEIKCAIPKWMEYYAHNLCQA